MPPARNDPCPCGSGKKHKKCCGTQVAIPRAADGPDDTPLASRARRIKALDQKLSEDLLRFARVKFPRGWFPDALDTYADGDSTRLDAVEHQIAIPWVMYHYAGHDGDRSLAQRYRDKRGAWLSSEMREVLDANLRSRISLLEVRHVERGVGVAVVDRFTGDERFVHEISGSRTLNARDTLLGCVVTYDDVSFFGGIHPRTLGPRDADEVHREFLHIRRQSGDPEGPVSLETLADPDVQLELIDQWRAAADEQDRRPLPTLTNTDGDLFVLTTDHFDIHAADQPAVLERLATFAGASDPEQYDDGTTGIAITTPGNAQHTTWTDTLIGRITIRGDRLRVESNSTRRADRLRDALTAHLAELAMYAFREEMSQSELAARARQSPPDHRPSELPPPEVIAALRDIKEQHMIAWLDMSLPSLGGLTPRAAARSAESGAALELVLREIEHQEARTPDHERFDVRRLRAALDFPGD